MEPSHGKSRSAGNTTIFGVVTLLSKVQEVEEVVHSQARHDRTKEEVGELGTAHDSETEVQPFSWSFLDNSAETTTEAEAHKVHSGSDMEEAYHVLLVARTKQEVAVLSQVDAA